MSDQPTPSGQPMPPEDGATMAFNPQHIARPAGQIEIAAPLESGSRIGPYEVREHVGDGGMAAVYKVWHTGLHRFEALKIPRYQASRGPEADFLHRLLAEARTAAGLHHPHIVAIHNVSDEKSVLHYFAMEFVDGSDLASLIAERGALPFEEALTILRQIGGALDYAHAHNVVHRDVKPANILLQRNEAGGWHAKVVDFGISRAGEDNGSTRLTRSGMIVGTPEYMSPEQSGSGAAVDHRTDIYSLGVVAYEMLCGNPPFVAGDGVSRISVLMKQMNEPPLPPDHCRPELPVSASAAVLKALSKNPEDRFSSCGEFLAALSAAPMVDELPAGGPLGEARRRGTIAAAAIAGTGAATVNRSRTKRTRVGDITDSTGTFEAPIPAERARRATRRTSLIAGFLGLLLGSFIVWSQRQPPPAAPVRAVVPVVSPTPTPQVVKAAPTATKKPQVVTRPTPKPTPKPDVKPKAATRPQKPVVTRKSQPTTPQTARTLQKPTVRRATRRRPAQNRKTTPRVARPRATRPAWSGGEAPLPP